MVGEFSKEMGPAQKIEPLLDAKEVKRLLKCSLPFVYKLACEGRIPCVRLECPGEGTAKLRTMVRFKLQDVIALIEEHYQRKKGT
jgi:hypothetical protein